MSQLREIELADVLHKLPAMESLQPGRDMDGARDDIFICALGFEDRCLNIPRQLRDTGYHADISLYCVYATNEAENEVNRDALESHLKAFSDVVHILDADDPHFVSQLRDRVVSVGSSDHVTSITFDCSVAANRLVLKCMKVILESDACVRVLYSEASVYHPTKVEYAHDPKAWTEESALGLARGVSSVAVSLDHSGHHLDPLPDCVMVFPTFKPERSRAVLSFVDPSLITSPGDNVIWLLGVPHLDEDAWRLTAMRDVNEITSGLHQKEVSTFDYRDTLVVLEEIHKKRARDFKLSLSPLGSKMQAIGSSLFYYLHPDVRVIFAAPEVYNATQYSDGCKAMWQLQFGSMPRLRQELITVGSVYIDSSQ